MGVSAENRCRQGCAAAPRASKLHVMHCLGLGGLMLGFSACAVEPPESPVPIPTANPETALRYVQDTTWPQPAAISFDTVSWMQVDRQTGLIHLLQRSQPPVSVWNPAGQLLSQGPTEVLGDPHSITLRRGADAVPSTWITDMAPPQPAGQGFGHCLKELDSSGNLVRTIGVCGENSQGTGLDPVQFDKVTDVAFDSLGHLFVADGDLDGLNNRVLKMTPEGEVLMDWSAPNNQPGSGPREFDLPHEVLVDDCDRVWIADALNHRIQVISNQGEYYGELSCFGDYGVYGLAFSAALHAGPNASNTLFVTSSPTDGENRGNVSVFDVPMDCSQPQKIGACNPLVEWHIELPPTEDTAMLHDVTASNDGKAIYISVLGGNLPPQKWIALPGQP